MNIERDDPEGLRRPAESEDLEQLYGAVRGSVGALLVDRGMPDAAIDAVLYDAFSEYTRLKESVENPVAWLTDAVFALAATYLRLRGLDAAPEPDDIARLADLVVTHATLAKLPERTGQVVRLRYFERKSFEQIAEELDITAGAAAVFMNKAIAMLEEFPRRYR
jgi:RNA polymerase sigma factor (sigma-70 family)